MSCFRDARSAFTVEKPLPAAAGPRGTSSRLRVAMPGSKMPPSNCGRLGLPVAYFYAEDDELTRLIREFQLQGKGKGKPRR